MSKILIKKFNKIVNEFADELSAILPNDKNIAIFKSHLSVVGMLDDTQIIKNFIEHVYPYKKNILDKDEEFFLETEIKHDHDYLSDSLHIKQLWKDKLSDSNKEIVWKYFQVLIVLSEKYIVRGNSLKL